MPNGNPLSGKPDVDDTPAFRQWLIDVLVSQSDDIREVKVELKTKTDEKECRIIRKAVIGQLRINTADIGKLKARIAWYAGIGAGVLAVVELLIRVF